MALPVATRDVHIMIVDAPTGTAASGVVRFVNQYALYDSTDAMVLAPGTYTATLDASGEATIALPVSDEAGVTPTGWSYSVFVRTGVWSEDGYCVIETDDLSTLEFADIFPSATVTAVSTYATTGQMTAETAARIAGDAVVTATTANLTAIANAINTTDKVAGKQVWNSSTSKPVWATGALAASTWVFADGTLAHTPA